MQKYSRRYHQKKPQKERVDVSKKKTHKSDEDFRGEIRQLKSVIRNLQKRLRYYEKIDHMLEDAMDVVDEERSKQFVEEVKADRCPDCTRGELRLVDLGRVSYTACTICNYRVKTHGKEKE